MAKFYMLVFILQIVSLTMAAWDADCNNPPLFEGECCNDSIFSENIADVKTCAQKFNLPVNAKNHVDMTPANIEAYVCYTDCIYVGLKFIKDGNVDMAAVKSNVTSAAKTAPELATTMINAVETCIKQMPKIIEKISKMPNADKLLKGKCSATAQLIDDCVEMEYYTNCPAKYWSSSVKDCDDIKAYSAKCKMY